jgi:hypothetical protein
MSQTNLLALLAAAHPGASQGDLLAMLDTIPDKKAARKPTQARSGSRPRTDASMERRRSWAASGRMPPRLACRFTLAEQAVLSVVAVEIVKKGECTLTIGHISALAGVCNQTVRNAMRQAEALGFLRSEVRRRSAWRNDPNRVTIVSPEWLSWLRLGRRGEGQKPWTPRLQDSRKQAESRSAASNQKVCRRAEGWERASPGEIQRGRR